MLRHRILQKRQIEATRRRVAGRITPRVRFEDALTLPCSLVRANTPDRIAQRLDRITRYNAGDELPETTPTEPPVQLLAKAFERAPVPNSTPPE